ncbi:MAG: DUF2254 domain-containing protein [Gemmatimonadota bacterium]|nr:DUF2254 domain-containing protein [Gemmatimonadota bacterium]
MLARLTMVWVKIRDSLWFLPALLTLLASGLAVLVVELEKRGVLALGDSDHWLLGGGAEGARGVLSAIAGGLITVTGVVFSVTIVALQLASSQFTPRVLRNFTADRSNQLVLGVFIGTFTYTLLVLRTVRSPAPDQEAFIPRIAVALAVGLVLLSIAFLIFFINHAARSIQVSVILERVTRLTVQHTEKLFPETVGRPSEEEQLPEEMQQAEIAAVSARQAGYLQAVDGKSLFELGESKRLVIRMERHIGEFVLPGQRLASVWPAELLDEEVTKGIHQAFVLGPERTPEQDVEFGIIEIADIAVKALSPGINDPTTALHCLDRLGEVLLSLGTRFPPPDVRTREGHVHFIACHLGFERAVGLAFDQIRHYGSDNPSVAKKMLDVLTSLERLVPEARRAPLRAQAERVLEEAREGIRNPPDLLAVERVPDRSRSAAGRR